jgi:hypothetical protein
MKSKFYLILSLVFIVTQYSYGQFLDYDPIPLQNHNSYNIERSNQEFEEMIRRKELEAKQQMEYERRAESARKAAQPIIFNEELITVTGMNISQDKEVKAKINQKTYSDGQVVNYVIGLKYDNNWISVKETLLPKISVLIKMAESNGQEEVKQSLLEMSEYANYVLVVNNEFIIF